MDTAQHAGTSIRVATTLDHGATAAIYNQEVLGGIGTFDTEPKPDDHYASRIASRRPGDHFLVATMADRVVGFAYAGDYRPRPAYSRTREVSVYLDADSHGQGLGRRLYDDLLPRLARDGVHVALAVIALPNDASEALHRAVGFQRVGVLPQVGRKFDRWIETALWARRFPDSGHTEM